MTTTITTVSTSTVTLPIPIAHMECGVRVKVGLFNIDPSITAGNTQSITGIGFRPKAIILFISGSIEEENEVAGGTYRNCIGFGDGTLQEERGTISIDNVTTSDSYSVGAGITILRACTTTTPTYDGYAHLESLDADGFTLTIDDQFANPYRVSYLAIGGDDITAKCNRFTFPSTTGEFDITGVGFQPGVIMFQRMISGARSMLGWGMATGSSNQGISLYHALDAVSTSSTHHYGYSGECGAAFQIGSTTIQFRDTFVSFNGDGARLNHLEGAGTHVVPYLALMGGNFKVGEFLTRTDGNDISISGLGFTPKAILFVSVCAAENAQDVSATQAKFSMGVATFNMERNCQAISDEHGLDFTETAYACYDDAVYVNVKDDAVQGKMDIKSFDNDGFTCVMDDPDPSACWVNYLAIG